LGDAQLLGRAREAFMARCDLERFERVERWQAAQHHIVQLNEKNSAHPEKRCFAVRACGLYFTPKSGRKYFIVAVTEDAVSSRQIQTSVIRPPWVLGNAVISKWEFIDSADNKTLTPAGGK